jgi:hypothetical protein
MFVNTLRSHYELNSIIRSIRLQRWYISITITILNIIYPPVFYYKHYLSKTGFCLWRQEIFLLIEVNWVGSTCKRRQNPAFEASCFKQKTERWLMPRILIPIISLYDFWVNNYWHISVVITKSLNLLINAVHSD